MTALPSTNHLETKALYRICQLISSAMNLEMVLKKILKILHDTLNMERATLALLDETGSHLVIHASYGLTEEEARRGIYRPDEGVVGMIFRSRRPFVVPNVHREPLFLNRTGARKNIEKREISFIGVPVLFMEEPVGVLSVDRLFGPDISFEEDIRFLTVVATLIAQFLGLHRAIRRREQHLIEENTSLKSALRDRYSFQNIIGQCKGMQEVYRLIEKVAPSGATILILGESGTGKELIAHAIHQLSRRREKPMVKVNCAAVPETLLESELFGHEKGSFTGAQTMRKGRFELAHGGTIFLDEIGELPLGLQAKLLRALQERQFERVGGTKTIQVDVRIIAATNRSLEKAVREKTFREDLFYRLNVVPITLPPLRERAEDIPMLLDHFLHKFNKLHGKNLKVSRDVIDFFMTYPWPGNVRELQNLVERLVLITEGGVVRMEALPSYMVASSWEDPLPQETSPYHVEPHTSAPHTGRLSLREIERREIEAALIRHGWVKARAARALGLTERQIGYRIQKYRLTPPDFSGK